MLSVSAPTDAAVTMADRLGIALVGFARESGFTIYSHPERIDFTTVIGKSPSIIPLLTADRPIAHETLLAA